MVEGLIPAIASVIVIIITVIGQWINSRNDRNLTNLELDILKKLDSNTNTAEQLSEVIDFRIATWRLRITKSRRLLRSAIVWFVVGYIVFSFAVPLAAGTTVRVLMIQVINLLSVAMFVLGVVLIFIGGWKGSKAFGAWWDERQASR